VHIAPGSIGYKKPGWYDMDSKSWTNVWQGQALLSTCWEAHEVFIAGHHVLQDREGDRSTEQRSSPPIYFKPDTDTLLMPRHCFCFPQLLDLNVSKVTKVAFFDNDVPDFGKGQMISLVEGSFHAVKHLSIVHSSLEWHAYRRFEVRSSIVTKKLHLFTLNGDLLEVVRSSGMSQDAITLRRVSRIERYPRAGDPFAARMNSTRWAEIACDVAVLGCEVADNSQLYRENQNRNEFERLAIQQADLRSSRCQLVTFTCPDAPGRLFLKRTVYCPAKRSSKLFIEPFDMPKRARKVTWLNQGSRDKSEPLLYSYTKPRNHREVWFTGSVPLVCDENGIPKTQGKYEGLERMFAGENVEFEEQDEPGA
jgi:hypothetical protein